MVVLRHHKNNGFTLIRLSFDSDRRGFCTSAWSAQTCGSLTLWLYCAVNVHSYGTAHFLACTHRFTVACFGTNAMLLVTCPEPPSFDQHPVYFCTALYVLVKECVPEAIRAAKGL